MSFQGRHTSWSENWSRPHTFRTSGMQMRGERGVTHKTLEQETTAHVPFQPRKTVLELFKVVFVFWEQLRSHYFFSLNPNMWQGLCPNKAGQQTHSGSFVPLRRGMSRDIPCIYNLFFNSKLFCQTGVNSGFVFTWGVFFPSQYLPKLSIWHCHFPTTFPKPNHTRNLTMPLPLPIPKTHCLYCLLNIWLSLWLYP